MSRYVLKGTKNRGESVGSIRLDEDRVLVLDGEPVEMSEAEHDNLVNQGYTLHKRRDRASDKPDDKKSGDEDDNDNEDDTPEKGGDN